MTVCTSCGARLAASAERCDLCGTPVDEPVSELPEEEQPVPHTTDVAVTTDEESSVFCISCGSESPAHAKFCWKCGTALVSSKKPSGAVPVKLPRNKVTTARPETSAVPPDQAGRRAVLMVIGAALLVAVLFVITILGGRQNTLVSPEELAEQSAGATAAAAPSTSIPPEVSARIAFLEREVAEAADDETRIAMHQALIQELIDAELYGSAGDAQQELAEDLATADAWADAGALFLAQMLRSDPAGQPVFAERSIYAFERSLEMEPGNLDVMTDLATAYLQSPTNPMHGVELVQEVLESDPNHSRARLNYALMLMQIGRDDQAVEELRKVLTISEPGDFIYDRAQLKLDRLGQ